MNEKKSVGQIVFNGKFFFELLAYSVLYDWIHKETPVKPRVLSQHNTVSNAEVMRAADQCIQGRLCCCECVQAAPVPTKASSPCQKGIRCATILPLQAKIRFVTCSSFTGRLGGGVSTIYLFIWTEFQAQRTAWPMLQNNTFYKGFITAAHTVSTLLDINLQVNY